MLQKLLMVVNFEIPTTGLIILLTFIAGLLIFIGWGWGNSKQGFVVNKTNEIPNSIYRVESVNKKRTVLVTQIGTKEVAILITAEAFGGKPIRPGDSVKKFNGTWKQQKALGIPNLGYAPLVKVEEEVNEEIKETNSETFKTN
jgi:hypothetical protein